MRDDKNSLDLGISSSGLDERARDGEMEDVTPRNGSNEVKRDLQRRHIVRYFFLIWIAVPILIHSPYNRLDNWCFI